jgi:hypothetical protein
MSKRRCGLYNYRIVYQLCPIPQPMPSEPIVFTANGTWTKPLNVSHLEIIAIGGGGGGGGGDELGGIGGNGGIVTTVFNVNPAITFILDIIVGLGGVGTVGFPTGGGLSSVVNGGQSITVVAGGGGGGGLGIGGGTTHPGGNGGYNPITGYGQDGDGNYCGRGGGGGYGGAGGNGGGQGGDNWPPGTGGDSINSGGGGGGGYGGGGGANQNCGGGGGGSTSTGFNTTYTNPVSGPGLGGIINGNNGQVTILYY